MDWGLAGFVASAVGVLVGATALVVMLVIAARQSEQIGEQRKLLEANEELARELDAKVLGTLPIVEDVNDCIRDLMTEAEQAGDSVYLMCYWLWFGADLGFPVRCTAGQIGQDRSEVAKLLWVRASKRMPTTVVIYDPTAAEGELLRFLRAVLKYDS